MGLLENKYQFEIKVPSNIKIEYLPDKARIKGSKDDISKFVEEFRKLAALDDNHLVKLDKLTLKVSDYITTDKDKDLWVELPNHAWNIMSSKFQDVVMEMEDNPFDFNDCGYTDKIPYDIGVEITDLPFRYLEINEDGSYQTKIINR